MYVQNGDIYCVRFQMLNNIKSLFTFLTVNSSHRLVRVIRENALNGRFSCGIKHCTGTFFSSSYFLNINMWLFIFCRRFLFFFRSFYRMCLVTSTIISYANYSVWLPVVEIPFFLFKFLSTMVVCACDFNFHFSSLYRVRSSDYRSNGSIWSGPHSQQLGIKCENGLRC